MEENDILSPLEPIENLLIVTKGGAQPILLDKYDEYLNMPLKIVKMSDLVNYLDIFEKYHSQFPNEKKVLNSYLKIDKIILGFSDYISDFGTKKRVQRFLNKLNIFFDNAEKEPNFKEFKLIIPYYLDYSTFLDENPKYQINSKKCKGLLVFNDLNKNINNAKILEYKDKIEKMKKHMENEQLMLIKASSENIIDLIIGTLIGCNYFEINFPHVFAQNGQCLNIAFNEYKEDKDYGKISDLPNLDFELNLLDMNDIKYGNETINITEGCQCFSCLTGYKRSYICHLFKCKELNGPIIISIHNYYQVRQFYKKLSEYKGDENKINNFVMWFLTTQCKKIQSK